MEKSMISPRLFVLNLSCKIEAIYFETVIAYFVLIRITVLFANEGGKFPIIGIKMILETICLGRVYGCIKISLKTPQHSHRLLQNGKGLPF